jgi:hypothetical protein
MQARTLQIRDTEEGIVIPFNIRAGSRIKNLRREKGKWFMEIEEPNNAVVEIDMQPPQCSQ